MKPGVQIDHPHIESCCRKSIGTSCHHDPTHLVHIQCILHLVMGRHMHGLSSIFGHDKPRLHRSHIWPPKKLLKNISITSRTEQSKRRRMKFLEQYFRLHSGKVVCLKPQW